MASTILSDTSSLTLDNPVGTDSAGYAGLEDGVDWHWKRIFSGAALITLLGISVELASPKTAKTATASSLPDATAHKTP